MSDEFRLRLPDGAHVEARAVRDGRRVELLVVDETGRVIRRHLVLPDTRVLVRDQVLPLRGLFGEVQYRGPA